MNDPSLKVSANGQANENEGPEKAIDADMKTKWSCRYQYADNGKSGWKWILIRNM